VKSINNWLSSSATRTIRRYLVGPQQQWYFKPLSQDWKPPRIDRTSMYLHVPFCRNCCPYCPYTKVPYDKKLIDPYTKAALNEVNWWAEMIGPTELTSLYIGGGTPTLALDSIANILSLVRKKFRLTGEICIETNPVDINDKTVTLLHKLNITLVSIGVQSFHQNNLMIMGRNYTPTVAKNALALLTDSNFLSVNVDLMFALPNQTADEVTADFAYAAQLGANQLTAYPLFTFPYTTVGKYLHLASVRMPNLHVRRTQYRAINSWCKENGFERVSVWGFKQGTVPRYSSVTRDGYIGIGPGAGSHLPDGFTINTFDLDSWIHTINGGRTAVALRMPFSNEMSGWWWLYWRLYDTRIPIDGIDANLGKDASKAHRLLKIAEKIGLAVRNENYLELTEPGAFWIHLAQNHFALNYVNKIWTEARSKSWPDTVAI